MKFRNSINNPGMEITLPNGMRIVAQLSGNADPNRPEADWAGINVTMVSQNGDCISLCSAEYIERDQKVRVFGHNGRINELDVCMEAPQPKHQWEPNPGTARLRLKLA